MEPGLNTDKVLAHKSKTDFVSLPPPLPSPLLCPHYTFLVPLILASKFMQDHCYSIQAWAKLWSPEWPIWEHTWRSPWVASLGRQTACSTICLSGLTIPTQLLSSSSLSTPGLRVYYSDNESYTWIVSKPQHNLYLCRLLRSCWRPSEPPEDGLLSESGWVGESQVTCVHESGTHSW